MIGHTWAQDLLRRAAQRGRLGHAYLIVGPVSVGKTALALFVAGMAVCSGEEPRPCGRCRGCRQLARGTHPDVRLIERAADRRDMTIDQVRGIEEEIGLAPYEAPRKLFCLCGADHLNDAAASALLKTLEEPPPHATLLLTAADPMALPSTIRSRCQHLTLQPVPATTIVEGLIAHHHVEPARARELADLARGRPGWAVQALETPELVERARVALATVETLAHGGPYTRLRTVEGWLGKGSFVENRERALALLALLESWWRDLLLLRQSAPGSPLHGHLVGSPRQADWAVAEIVALLTHIQETAARVEANVTPRLALEHLVSLMPKAPGAAHAAR